jgi:hypothetical protein
MSGSSVENEAVTGCRSLIHRDFRLQSLTIPKTTFHVIDARDDSIIGSISAKPAEEADLLAHWIGPAGRGSQHQPPVANAKLSSRPLGRMSQKAILRGC